MSVTSRVENKIIHVLHVCTSRFILITSYWMLISENINHTCPDTVHILLYNVVYCFSSCQWADRCGESFRHTESPRDKYNWLNG